MKKKKRTPKSSAPSILDSENWVSESSVQAFAAPASNARSSGSGSGSHRNYIKIEFTCPEPPSRILPCGEQIEGDATVFGPDASGVYVTVTGPDGMVCGEGTGQCIFQYEPSSEECGEDLTFTASADNCDDAKGKVAVPKVTIGEIPRIPIYKNIPDNLKKCTITSLPADITLTAEMKRDEDSGTEGLARFGQGGSSMPVKGTIEISIAGVENSNAAENMRFIVKSGDTIYAEKRFSVRTWPKRGWFNPNEIARLEGGLLSHFRWISESGTVQDLKTILVGEIVNYNPVFPTPPYGKPLPENPTILSYRGDETEAGRSKALGYARDLQNAKFFDKPYSTDVNVAIQSIGFWDPVLDGFPDQNNQRKLEWGIQIKRKIVQRNDGTFVHTIEKLGVESRPYILPENP